MKIVLLIEKNLVNALEYEKLLKSFGFEVVGIGFDFMTSLLNYKDHQPDIIFCNPNLMLKGEGLEVVEFLNKNEETVYLYCDGSCTKDQIMTISSKSNAKDLLNGFTKEELTRVLSLDPKLSAELGV